jgi:acyl-[acyl-carrier-protein]-phospholipid O-acyltransferase / long-chain-fatty-acid--[acyl-carrier-protein] ligase
MLWISGPNVMAGYLHDPVASSKVLVDGWYKTGDLAYIDSDGFLFITGRESRFSKIGGEMVPHGVIEEALQKIVGENPDAPPRVAVTAVPDTRKGERLVVLHTSMEQTPSQICAALRNAGLANLWVPSPSDFVEVDAIPLLGTGKADLKAMRTLAAAARKGHEDE